MTLCKGLCVLCGELFHNTGKRLIDKLKTAFFVRSMRRLALIILVVSMTLTLQVSKSYGQSQAPDFTLSDLNGARFSLSDFRGKIVLLDFFATWCPGCIQEIYHLKTLTKLFPNNTLAIISISEDFPSVDDPTLRAFVRDHAITWTVARDTAGVGYQYEVFEYPTLILIYQEGRLGTRYVGLVEGEVLQSKIQLMIPEFTIPAITMALALTATFIMVRRRQ